MARRSTQVVGLDIGTTKVCALIAEPSETGPPAVLGVGSCPSRGTKRGRIKGFTSSWRKAIVTLAPGQKIQFFEGV